MATIKRAVTSTKDAGSDRSGGDRARRKMDSLWSQYRRTRSDGARNRLVERYRGLVESMALAMAARLPRSIDPDDLAHAGMWGLMQAIEAFRLDGGAQFLHFMRIRVRGAMRDELRAMDHLPRLLRIRRRTLDRAEGRLRGALCRPPTDAELAAELGVSEASLRRRFADPLPPGLRPAPREGSGEGPADPLEAVVDDHLESPLEAINRRELLEKIQQSLQPIEWKVLRLHYLEGMSSKDVARKLRLSASRVCQLRGRVLAKLKAKLSSIA